MQVEGDVVDDVMEMVGMGERRVEDVLGGGDDHFEGVGAWGHVHGAKCQPLGTGALRHRGLG